DQDLAADPVRAEREPERVGDLHHAREEPDVDDPPPRPLRAEGQGLADAAHERPETELRVVEDAGGAIAERTVAGHGRSRLYNERAVTEPARRRAALSPDPRRRRARRHSGW